MTPAPQDVPVIRNPDGSISTEKTITVGFDDRFYNIPTIVGGKQLSEEEAISAYRSGKSKASGSFSSIPEAVSAAKARSFAGGALSVLGSQPVSPDQLPNLALTNTGETLRAVAPLDPEKHAQAVKLSDERGGGMTPLGASRILDSATDGQRRSLLNPLPKGTRSKFMDQWLAQPDNAAVAQDDLKALGDLDDWSKAFGKERSLWEEIKSSAATGSHGTNAGIRHLMAAFGAGDIDENLHAIAGSNLRIQQEQMGQSKEIQEYMRLLSLDDGPSQYGTLDYMNPLKRLHEQRAMQGLGSLIHFASSPTGMAAQISQILGGAALEVGVGATAGLAGPVAGVVAYGVAGTLAETGREIERLIIKAGYDHSDYDSLRQAYSDSKLIQEAREAGARRGITIGLVNAFSGIVGARAGAAAATAVGARQKIAAVGTGVLQETGLEVIGEAAGQVASGMSLEALRPEEALLEGIGSLGVSGAEVAVFGGPSYAIRKARQRVEKAAKAAEAVRLSEAVHGLSRAFAESKYGKRLPGRLRALTGALLAGTDPEAASAYTDLEVWNKHWLDQGIDPAVAAEEMAPGVGGQRYADAGKTGEVVMPLPAFVEATTKDQGLFGLMEDTSFSEDGMTISQSREALEEAGAVIEEEPESEALSDPQDPIGSAVNEVVKLFQEDLSEQRAAEEEIKDLDERIKLMGEPAAENLEGASILEGMRTQRAQAAAKLQLLTERKKAVAATKDIEAQFEQQLLKAGRTPKQAKLVATLQGSILRSISSRALVPVADLMDLAVRQVKGDKKAANDMASLLQTAFHGSPHRFDKFDLGKIGTGEGHQAFGWGLYFADQKAVAEAYKAQLTPKSLDMPADLRSALKSADNLGFDSAGQAMSAIRAEGKSWTTAWDVDQGRSEDEAELVRLVEDQLKREIPTGAVYTVDLAPAEDEYLLWDRPLSEQSEKVKKAIVEIGYDANALAGQTGAGLYESLKSAQAPFGAEGKAAERMASQDLLAAGIPGIKYLDQGSRGAGEGSYNYVLFDDRLVTITKLEQEARGATFLPQEPGSRAYTIELYETANASTMIHELSHAWMDAIYALGSVEGAAPGIIELRDQMVKITGVTPEQYAAIKAELKSLYSTASVRQDETDERLYTVLIPAKFYEDHTTQRRAAEGKHESLERRGNRVSVSLDAAAIRNLRSDAAYYADMEGLDPAYRDISKSAKATIEALKKQLPDDDNLDFKKYARLFQKDAKARIDKLVAPLEKFAKQFEAYAREGKAPSKELQPAFAAFRAWMKRIYTGIRRLGVRINPDIRAFFDRLVASDEEIEMAREEMGAAILDPEILKALPEEDRQRVIAAARNADDTSKARLNRDVLASWQAQRDAARGKAMVSAREEAADLVSKMPEVRAITDMQEGRSEKFSRKAVAEEYGLESDRYRTLEEMGLLVDDGGLAPSQVAEAYTMSSGESLIDGIIIVRDRPVIIERLAAAIVRHNNPELLSTPEVRKRAREYIVSEERAASLLAQRDALLKLAKEDAKARREAFAGVDKIDVLRKRAAADVAVMPYQQASRLGQMFAAIGKQARKAKEHASKSEHLLAAQAITTELYNMERYRLAAKGVKKADKNVARMKDFGRKSYQVRLGKGGKGELAQANSLLKKYLVAPFIRQHERKQMLGSWLSGLGADSPAIATWIVGGLDVEPQGQHWRSLTLEQIQDLRDGLEQIYKHAQDARELHTSKIKEARLKAQADVVASVEANKKTKIKRGYQKRAPVLKRWWLASRPIDSLAYQMDGLKEGESVWYHLVRGPSEAETAEVSEHALTNKEFRRIFAMRSKEDMRDWARPTLAVSNDRVLTLEQRIAIALYYGNKEGRERLSRQFTKADMAKILGSLNQRHADMVSAMHKIQEAYWPSMQGLWERVRGIAPPKVEVTPFDTVGHDGSKVHWDGGYTRLKYQGQNDSAVDLETMADHMINGRPVRETMDAGSMHERVDRLPGAELRLDLGVVISNVAEIVHVLTHMEIMLDAKAILSSPDVRKAITDYHGHETYDEFLATYDSISAGHVATTDAVEQVMQYLRAGTILQRIGLRLTTLAVNVGGFAQSIARMSPSEAAGVGMAMIKLMRQPKMALKIVGNIHKASKAMANRALTLDRDAYAVRRQMGISKLQGYRDFVSEYSFGGLAVTQMMVDLPIWMGAFMHAGGNVDALIAGKDVSGYKDAIAIADQAVVSSQGGGRIIDMARVQRGNAWQKLFTTFMGYGIRTVNVTAESTDRIRQDPKSIAAYGRFAWAMIWLYGFPAMWTMMITRMFRGDTRDEEEPLEQFLRNVGGQAVSGIVIAREAQGRILGVGDYEGPAGAAAISEGLNLFTQALQGEADDAFIRAALEFGGILTHLPTAQFIETMQGVEAAMAGDTSWAQGLTVGAPRK